MKGISFLSPCHNFVVIMRNISTRILFLENKPEEITGNHVRMYTPVVLALPVRLRYREFDRPSCLKRTWLFVLFAEFSAL